jgi:hypothetical protein
MIFLKNAGDPKVSLSLIQNIKKEPTRKRGSFYIWVIYFALGTTTA